MPQGLDRVWIKYENLSKNVRLWTSRTTLASAYMLYHLFVTWLQLQIVMNKVQDSKTE